MLSAPSVKEVREAVRTARAAGQRVGCVMTMGALHAGHRALLDAARRECEFVVATIFVNPTQFAPGEDLDKYPRPLEDDLALCEDADVDVIFLPDVETMYPPGAQTTITVSEVSQPLEGVHRPTHYAGVATVVLKLLNITQPDVAYFGQKDYQQCAVIRQMVRDLDVPVTIETVATVRDPDGLALSSRNRYLTNAEREIGLRLIAALHLADAKLKDGIQDVASVMREMHQLLTEGGAMNVDYAVVADPDTLETLTKPQPRMVALIAAHVGTTRLIDNMLIDLT